MFDLFNRVFTTIWFETRNFVCFWVLYVLSLCAKGDCYTAATDTNNVLFIFVCAPDFLDLMYYLLMTIS